MMTSFAIRPKMAKVRFPGRGSQQRPLVSVSEIIDSLSRAGTWATWAEVGQLDRLSYENSETGFVLLLA